MPILPDAVYSAASMAVSGKTLIIASSGAPYGNYPRARVLAPDLFSNYVLAEVVSGKPVISDLPGAARVEAAMVAAGKRLVLDSSGTDYGHLHRVGRYVIPCVTFIAEGLLETGPAAAEVGFGFIPVTGTVYEAAAQPADEESSGGPLKVIFQAPPVALEQANGFQAFVGLYEEPPVATESATGTLSPNGVFETAPTATEVGSGLTYANIPAKPGVTQVLIEVAPHFEQDHNPPKVVVTQDAVEWSFHPPNTIFETQACVEVLVHRPDLVFATQTCIEVAYKPLRTTVKARYKRFLPAPK
jgi:hypothetical protein